MGIGTGAAAVEDIGQKPATIADLEKTAGAIRDLWAGRNFSTNGRECRLEYAATVPGMIPVYVAASGPRLIRTAARIADGVLCNIGAEPERLANTVRSAGESAQAAGNRTEFQIAARVPACITDEPDAARYVRARVGIAALRRDPAEFSPDDRAALEKIKAAFSPREHLRLNAAYTEQVTDSLIDKFALAGSPEACVDRIRRLMQTGIDELNLAFMHPDTEMLLRTFAARVMPRL
jgi:5,10-methylenetetrahydromethanopterin reductase